MQKKTIPKRTEHVIIYRSLKSIAIGQKKLCAPPIEC